MLQCRCLPPCPGSRSESVVGLGWAGETHARAYAALAGARLVANLQRLHFFDLATGQAIRDDG